MDKLADLIIRFRVIVITAFIAVTLFFATQLPRVEFEPNVKNMLPEGMPSLVSTDKIEEVFSGTEMIMILVKSDDLLKADSLRRVKRLSKRLARVKGIEKVLSLFDLKSIKGSDGMMIVDPAVKRIPKTPSQKQRLKEELKDNDMVYGTVISKDFTTTAVMGILAPGANEDEVSWDSEKIIAEFDGDEEIILGGLPYTRHLIGVDMPDDMQRLVPMGLVIMLIFLFIAFKQLRGVLLPFIVVVMSIILVMGMLPVLGWKVYIITVLLPVMLIAIANDYGIHLIAKYQEENTEDSTQTKEEIAKTVFKSLGTPIFLTGLTTMGGILCLLTHAIIPAKQLAVLASIGIGFALIASLVFITAMLSFLPRGKCVLGKDKKPPLLDRLLIYTGCVVSNYPKRVLLIAVTFSLVVFSGIKLLIVDTNPVNYYPEDAPVPTATRMVDSNFGGSTPIGIIVKGDIKHPKIMNKIDALEAEIDSMEEIGLTTSIAKVVKQMSRAINDKGEKFYDKIPDSRNAIAQYFELYSMSGDPDDFEKLVDFPYEHALVSARIKSMSTTVIDSVVNEIRKKVDEDDDLLLIGGFGTILPEMAKLVVDGQLKSLGLSILVIAVLLVLLFRSIMAGIISVIPLALSLAILFGLMGYAKIELNIATALLSSIMIGVGIDYTIHYLWRYREERRNGLPPSEATEKTLTTTGRGITFNALSVIIGFIALLTSSFMPVKFFGFLVVVSIAACLIGALVVVPALCIVLRPKFLEPSDK